MKKKMIDGLVLLLWPISIVLFLVLIAWFEIARWHTFEAAMHTHINFWRWFFFIEK